MNDIEEIKSRLDIVEVIKSYVPGLKRAGRSYKANCPFHQEDTPSFVVTPEMQRYKCFGCGEGGDVLNFIQQIERTDFSEALAIAADKAGYELKGFTPKDSKLEKEKQDIYEVNKLATKYWHYLLKTHKSGLPGRELMQQRNIRIEEVNKFRLGYAPRGNNLLLFLTSKGYTAEQLEKWGLATTRNGEHIDKFRNRFMMPIVDMKGNVLGFSGRIIGKSDYAPKYLNSPETQAYKKAESLIALYQAREESRKQNFMILVEGNIDPLSSHRVGIENIAATGGTALTEQQCKLIKRYAETVYFAFDSDSAGIKALVRGIDLCERVGLRHKVVNFGAYQDPDELINTAPEKWQEAISAPVNSVEFLLQLFHKDIDLGTADGKSEFRDRILPVLKSLKDQIQLDHFIERTALIVGVTKEVIREMLTTGSKPVRREEEKPEKTETPSFSRTDTKELYLLALLVGVNEPEIINKIDTSIIQDVNVAELIGRLQNAKLPIDLSKFAEELSDGGLETLQEAMATNVPTEDIEEEITTLLRSIKIANLKTNILSLREQLQTTPEDPETLQKLTDYTKELSSLERSPKA